MRTTVAFGFSSGTLLVSAAALASTTFCHQASVDGDDVGGGGDNGGIRATASRSGNASGSP